jgi:hypothetical protein
MRSVLLNPLDLLARFELADAIEDDMLCDPADAWPAIQLPDGVEVERDERGMPWGIRCTMGQWVGIQCPTCNKMACSTIKDWLTCPICHAIGHEMAIAARVCRVWPVGSVVLVDRLASFEKSWLNKDYFVMQKSALLGDLFRLLPLNGKQTTDWGFTEQICYRTAIEAKSALNHAALNLGRKRSGLPLL